MIWVHGYTICMYLTIITVIHVIWSEMYIFNGMLSGRISQQDVWRSKWLLPVPHTCTKKRNQRKWSLNHSFLCQLLHYACLFFFLNILLHLISIPTPLWRSLVTFALFFFYKRYSIRNGGPSNIGNEKGFVCNKLSPFLNHSPCA